MYVLSHPSWKFSGNHFECGNGVKISNRITFSFSMRVPGCVQMQLVKLVCNLVSIHVV